MSTFGNNLIERLSTRLIDVRSEDQLGQGSIALAKNLNINGNAKRDSPFGLVPANAATEHDVIEIFQLRRHRRYRLPQFCPGTLPVWLRPFGRASPCHGSNNQQSVISVRRSKRRRSMTYVRIWGFLDGLLNRRTCLAVAPMPARKSGRCDDPKAVAKEFHLCRLRRRLTFPKIARSIMTRNAPTQIGGQSGS